MMFRNIAISTLVLVYLTVTTGFSMATHFCNNKVVEVAFNKAEKPNCGETQKQRNCCEDKHITVKVSDNQEVISSNINLQAKSLMLFLARYHQLVAPEYLTTQTNLVSYHSPPIRQGIPLTIVYSVFRI
jgi:hypothetical protein